MLTALLDASFLGMTNPCDLNDIIRCTAKPIVKQRRRNPCELKMGAAKFISRDLNKTFVDSGIAGEARKQNRTLNRSLCEFKAQAASSKRE